MDEEIGQVNLPHTCDGTSRLFLCTLDSWFLHSHIEVYRCLVRKGIFQTRYFCVCRHCESIVMSSVFALGVM